MATKSVLIKLYIPQGSIAGPFELRSNVDDYVDTFQTDLTREQLSAAGGYLSTLVPEDTTVIRIQSTTNCQNYADALIAPADNCVGQVTIGGQLWTPCNLNVKQFRDGTPIPQITSDTVWSNTTVAGWAHVDYNPDNEKAYGILYNKEAILGIVDTTSTRKILAPDNYVIPTEPDFQILINYLNAQLPTGNVGGKMKATGIYVPSTNTNYWNSPNTGATNTSGFTALPAGTMYGFGDPRGFHDTACFWTANGNKLLTLSASSGNTTFETYSINYDGGSVRLLYQPV